MSEQARGLFMPMQGIPPARISWGSLGRWARASWALHPQGVEQKERRTGLGAGHAGSSMSANFTFLIRKTEVQRSPLWRSDDQQW